MNGQPPLPKGRSFSVVFSASAVPFPSNALGPVLLTTKPSGYIPSSPGSGTPIILLIHALGPHLFHIVGLTYCNRVSNIPSYEDKGDLHVATPHTS